MAIIDHSSIKRVTQDDGLESITLRSDLAARYIFLNETLLEGIGAVKVDDKYKQTIDLKEVIKYEDGKVIVDEMEYLKKWQDKLQKEINEITENKEAVSDFSADKSHEKGTLDELINALEGPFKNKEEFEDLCTRIELLKKGN